MKAGQGVEPPVSDDPGAPGWPHASRGSPRATRGAAVAMISETLRGARARCGWFIGAPFFSLRVLTQTKTRKEAQVLLERRARQACEAWGLKVEVSGEPPPPGADVFGMVPLAKSAFRRIGLALVPRGNRAGTDRVLAEMVEAVKAGERVGWGAEGRFAGRDEVGRFKVGASLIAIRAQAPLVPVAFRGGHAAMHHGSLRARAGTVRVRYGAPIPTTGLTEDDARTLADRAQAIVTEMYAALGT